MLGKASFGRSELTRGADKTILNRAEEIHETATAVLASLADYGVTQAKLNALSKKIEAFRKAHPAPRQRVNAGRAATRQLSELFADLSALLRNRADRLLVQFRESAPEFYNEYQSARTLVNPPTVVVAASGTSTTTVPKGDRILSHTDANGMDAVRALLFFWIGRRTVAAEVKRRNPLPTKALRLVTSAATDVSRRQCFFQRAGSR